MRKTVLLIVATGSVAVLLSVRTGEAQRLAPIGGSGSASNPVPVAVYNFPSVQPVAGSVTVANLPQTVNIAGSVAWANIPLENGALKTTGVLVVIQQAPHIVGFTQATFLGSQGGLNLTRACAAEFPQGRVCEQSELFHSIPVPSEWPDQARVVVDPSGGAVCFGGASGRQESCSGTVPSPVACCGF